TVLPHSHKIIGDSLPTHARIFLELLVKQTDCFRSLHRRHWVFPDAHFGMEDESCLLENADQVAPKVGHADIAVTFFRDGQVHAMKAEAAPRHGHSVEVSGKK